MIRPFPLPDLGEGLTEAELVQWMVAAGDTVALNQPIAEVETAKAVVELPSPFTGVVRELCAAPGDAIDVGAVLIRFDVPDQEAAGPATTTDTTDAAAAAPAEQPRAATPNLVGYGAPEASGARPRRRARRQGAGATTLTDTAERPPRAAPVVRKIARERGVDLAEVTGSGPNGRISRADVEAFAAARPSTQRLGPADETRIPIRGVRKATAAAMVESAFGAPQVTTFLTVDVTATTELIASLRTDRAPQGARIGILAVAAKAVCLALPRHPDLNAHWDAAAGEIVQYRRIHLGIATATERGLVVPHVRDAGTLSLTDLATAIDDLAVTARTGRTAPEAMVGGTFTLTNVGVFGVDAGTPILNPGEAGILAVGAVRRLPWEHEGRIELRDVMTLALTFDHRLVDGEQGARFLTDVGAILREPGRAMLFR